MNEKVALMLTCIALLRATWTSSSRLIVDIDNKLSECLAAITGRYLHGNLVVISSNSKAETFEFSFRQHLHTITTQTFIASRTKNARKQYTKIFSDNFVLFVENVMQMSEFVDFLDENFVWNVKARFVVTLLSSTVSRDLQMEVVRHVIAHSWRRYLLNILVVTSSEASLQLYTWFPYSASGDCGRNLQAVTLLDEWRHNSGGFLNNAELFPAKLPARLNNCEITASTFTYEPHTFSRVEPFDENSEYFYRKGTDVQLFLAVAEASGYKARFNEPPPEHPRFGRWGDRLENGTAIGILGDVVNGKADVAFCCIRASVERCSMLDMTSVFIQNSHVWYVPHAEEIPRWKSIFIIFNVKIWLLIFFSCVLSSVVNYILNTRRVKSNNYVPLPILSPWYLLLGANLSKEPTVLRERLLLAQWLFYSLLMSSSYQSMLVGMLTDPGHERQITTVEELVNSKLHYGSIASARRFIPKQDNEIARRLYEGFEDSLSITSWKQKIASKNNYAFLGTITNSEVFLSSLYAQLGRDKYVRLQNGGMVFYNVMYLQRHSPYRERFDLVFSRIAESGIQLKWWTDIKTDERVKVLSKADSSETGDKLVIFTYEHVEGAFGILVGGITISVLVHLGEVLYCKLKGEMNAKKDTRIFL